MITCKNCGGPVPETYCSRCGQRHVEGRLTIKLVHDEAQGVFAKVLLKTGLTTWQLLRAPGDTANSYLAGRRKTYQEPLSYTGIALTAFFGLSAVSTKFFDIPPGPFQLGALPTIILGMAVLGLAFYFLATSPRHTVVETLIATLYAYGAVFWVLTGFIILQVVMSPILRAADLVWLPWAQAAVFQFGAAYCLVRLAISWQISILRMALSGAFAVLFFFGYHEGVERILCSRHISLVCRQ